MQNCTTPSSGNEITPQYGIPHGFQTRSRLTTLLVVALQIALMLFVLAMWAWLLFHIPEMAEEFYGWFGVTFLLLFCPLAAAGTLHNLVSGGTAYRFELDGLYQKRPFCQEKCIPWEEFQQICICNMRAGRHQTFLNGLFFVRHSGKPYRFRYVPEILNGNLGLGRRGVINMVYTPELYTGLAERCPLPIEDLRSVHK